MLWDFPERLAVLEWASGGDLQYLDVWLAAASPSKKSLSSSSPFPSLTTPRLEKPAFNFENTETLSVPALGDSPHSTDLRRIKRKEAFLLEEVQDLARWSEEEHSLAGALRKLEELLEKRFELLEELVKLAVGEAE
jgi:hypothetical protein